MSNSKSESESSPFFLCEDLIFLWGRGLADLVAEPFLDEKNSSSSSRSSSFSSFFLLSDGPECSSGRSSAPVTSNVASSSRIPDSKSQNHIHKIIANTFLSTFPVSAPCDNLLPDITLSIHDEHWYSGIRKVRDASVTNDGDKFRAWIAFRQCTNVLECPIASGYSNSSSSISCNVQDDAIRHTRLYKGIRWHQYPFHCHRLAHLPC